jgi:hypothetical protein
MGADIVSYKEEKVRELPWLVRVYGACCKYRHDMRRNIAVAAATLHLNDTLHKQ